jgi:hypothetical protein
MSVQPIVNLGLGNVRLVLLAFALPRSSWAYLNIAALISNAETSEIWDLKPIGGSGLMLYVLLRRETMTGQRL